MFPAKNLQSAAAGPAAYGESSLLKSGDSVKFEEIWPKIEPLVLRMFSDNCLSKAEWQDIFWNVHILCVWNFNSAISLQEKLVEVFDMYITKEQEYIFSKATNDLALLKAYMEAWKRFMFYYNYVPLPFQPLEKYFYKATTLAGSTAAGKKRHEIESYIRLTMIELWVLKIFSETNSRLIKGAMLLIDAERNNVLCDLCDPYLIIGVKESCLYLCYYLQDKLFIYRNNYERVYIATTEAFYRTSGQAYYQAHGILQYMKWVDGKIKEEHDRANRYLEPHSLSKVLSAVVNTLIGQYKDLLADKFLSLIKANDIVRLNLMFVLLDRVEGGIEPLLQKFEGHLVCIGIENLKMEALSIVQDSEKYIENLLKLFNMATNLVSDAFNGDPRFLTARDMAFNVLINDKSVFLFAFSQKNNFVPNTPSPTYENVSPSVTNATSTSALHLTGACTEVESGMASLAVCNNNNPLPVKNQQQQSTETGSTGAGVPAKMIESKCAELFANYCDMLLRKTNLSRHLTSDQIEGKLKNLILVLKYVQDKDMFMKFYKAHLTRRLILDASADNDKEEMMVNWLREVGMPADFVNKLSRMFQDLKVSEDFNRNFRDSTSEGASSIAASSELVSVKILNSSAWSRTHEKVNVSLPSEIEEVMGRIEEFYKTSHTGRNLLWHHQFSSGVISFSSDVGIYDFDVTSYQISILFSWNDRPDDSISLESLSLSTQLPHLELKRTLWSLLFNPKLKSQVLLAEPPVKGIKDLKDSTSFQLNTKFSLLTKNGRIMKRGRVNLIGRLQLQTEKFREDEAESILRLRTLRTQEAIMKILKTRKSITFAALHFELINVLKQMFIPSKALIKEQLEWLIEHEYIKRDATDANLFFYSL